MRRPLQFLAIVVLSIVAMYAYQALNKPPIYHAQSYVFGTLVDITIYGETDAYAAKVSQQISQDFQALHEQLHAWKALKSDTTYPHQPHAGELMTLNAAFAEGALTTKLSPNMLNILQDVQRLSAQSQGLFNPAIGHLISMWGFQRDNFTAIDVDENTIATWVAKKPSTADISIDSSLSSAKSSNTAVKLDLGGYAKGYALDRALATLKKANIKHALINIGGNIIALGQHGDKPWRVGIQHPRQPNAIATVALPSGWAIGTSGDYQRFFTLNGMRYCHIIDPRTGYPVQHTQAVTVLVPPQALSGSQAGVLSDVASKPIFIAEEAMQAQHAAQMQISDFMIINAQGHIRVSEPLAAKLTWLNPDEKFSVIH